MRVTGAAGLSCTAKIVTAASGAAVAVTPYAQKGAMMAGRGLYAAGKTTMTHTKLLVGGVTGRLGHVFGRK